MKLEEVNDNRVSSSRRLSSSSLTYENVNYTPLEFENPKIIIKKKKKRRKKQVLCFSCWFIIIAIFVIIVTTEIKIKLFGWMINVEDEKEDNNNAFPFHDCGCPTTCTQDIWNTIAVDVTGNYTCGERITWLLETSFETNYHDACILVSEEEFPNNICGPYCNPNVCNNNTAYTSINDDGSDMNDIDASKEEDDEEESKEKFNSMNDPNDNSVSYCGCPTSCTKDIWDRMAADDTGSYTCGERITWLLSTSAESNEYDACLRVSEKEFPTICGPSCNPRTCHHGEEGEDSNEKENNFDDYNDESSDELEGKVRNCGCPASCTEDIWNKMATDSTGSYTCGERITWLLETSNESNEHDACVRVAEKEFSNGICGPYCNPRACNNDDEKHNDNYDNNANNNDNDKEASEKITMLDEPNTTNLIWEDNFDYLNDNNKLLPNQTKWTYDIGDGCDKGICGWGNNELQQYTNTTNNAFISSNGKLNIRALYDGKSYTSSRLVSRMSWKYGHRIRIRASLANCTAKGTWSAIWMLPTNWTYGPWPNSGEIDIMENVGYEHPTVIHQTIHTAMYNGMRNTQKTRSISLEDEEKEDGKDNNNTKESSYHVYEIIWEENQIQFAIDNQVHFVYKKEKSSSSSYTTWPFDQEFHIIMNVAVGGNWGGIQGVDAQSFLKQGEGQTMSIDWIKVYSLL